MAIDHDSFKLRAPLERAAGENAALVYVILYRLCSTGQILKVGAKTVKCCVYFIRTRLRCDRLKTVRNSQMNVVEWASKNLSTFGEVNGKNNATHFWLTKQSGIFWCQLVRYVYRVPTHLENLENSLNFMLDLEFLVW